MSDFSAFAKLVKARFDALSKHELFVTNSNKDEVWAAYLGAFPEGTNPLYRERTEHDCSCCKQFIRNIGNVVAVIGGELHSVWDLEGAEYPYDQVAQSMSRYLKTFPISDLFRTAERKFGAEFSFEQLANGDPKKWYHFNALVANKHFTASPEQAQGEHRTTAQVFKRGLEELTPAAFDLVIELIEDNALYRGAEFLPAVKEFQALQRIYKSLTSDEARNRMVWTACVAQSARFRNTSIGTLLQDLSAGVEMEAAVRPFETKVAPTNYKRPSAVITKRMAEDALKTINQLGLDTALERRFAKLSDISVNNVLWVDNTAQAKMRDGVAGLLMDAVVAPPVTAHEVENIGIEDFMSTVLPKVRGMELYMGHAQRPNLVSLTAPVHADSGRLFKWGNDFAWSYSGNITDSIKEKVKRAGGNTQAPLRVSLGWFNHDDLDIHVYEPDGTHIYFSNKLGKLDVDMNAGSGKTREPVENVSWLNPKDGTYRIVVNQFSQRETSNVGFVIEIENNGAIEQYSYQKAVKRAVEVGTITLRGGRIVEADISGELAGGGISQEVWGIHTETYAKVETLMKSPNYWDGQAIGNKHWFFMLEGCRNDEPTRGIYNEYLNSTLDKHRKVFEVLGEKTKCAPAEEQLSGLGFSSTRGDTVQVRVYGDSLRKTYNINF